jgi:predicted AAA+ superfamily ATPase
MIDNLYNLSFEFLGRSKNLFERNPRNINLSDSKNPMLMVGQRGVGKTTFILQDLKKKLDGDVKSLEGLYVPCDHYKFRGHSLYESAEQFVLNGGKYLYLDEIHNYQDWSLELKSIIDSFPELSVVATGSSLIELQKGSHDLSRRVLFHELFGLSFREFIELEYGIKFPAIELDNLLLNHREYASDILKQFAEANRKLIPTFKAYLKHGFYPYYKKYSESEFYLTLQQNIDRTLDTDLLALNQNLTGNATRKLRRLLSRLSDTNPFEPEMRGLARSLSIGDERTLYDYLSYLEKGRLVKLLYGLGSLGAEMNRPEKIYLDNPNLCYAMLEREKISIGMLREIFFYCAVYPSCKVLQPSKGDFILNEKFTFEIGGAKKGFNQIKDLPNSFLAIDDTEVGIGNKIPLWLFGFLY